MHAARRAGRASLMSDEDQTVGDVLAIGSGVGLFLIVCAAGVNWYRSRRRKRRAAAAAAASGRTAAQAMRPAQDLPSPASAEVVRSSNWMTDADLFQYNTGKRAQWGDGQRRRSGERDVLPPTSQIIQEHGLHVTIDEDEDYDPVGWCELPVVGRVRIASSPGGASSRSPGVNSSRSGPSSRPSSRNTPSSRPSSRSSRPSSRTSATLTDGDDGDDPTAGDEDASNDVLEGIRAEAAMQVFGGRSDQREAALGATLEAIRLSSSGGRGAGGGAMDDSRSDGGGSVNSSRSTQATELSYHDDDEAYQRRTVSRHSIDYSSSSPSPRSWRLAPESPEPSHRPVNFMAAGAWSSRASSNGSSSQQQQQQQHGAAGPSNCPSFSPPGHPLYGANGTVPAGTLSPKAMRANQHRGRGSSANSCRRWLAEPDERNTSTIVRLADLEA